MRALVFLFFLGSCGHSPLSPPPSKKDYGSIPIKRSLKKHPPLNLKEDTSQKEDKLKKESLPISKISLLFGPGLYQSGAYIPFIRKLEEKKIPLESVAGHGLGGFFASMIAFGHRSDYIEWNYYKFLEKIKKEKPFGPTWLKEYEKTLLSNLQGKRIENALVPLLLPVQEPHQSSLSWPEKGNVIEILLKNMNPQSLSFTLGFVDPFIFRLKGGAPIVCVLSLHKAPRFQKNPYGYLIASYNQGVSIILKEQENCSDIIKLPLGNIFIDNPSKKVSENRTLIEFLEKRFQ